MAERKITRVLLLVCKRRFMGINMDPIRKPYSKDMQKYLQGKGKETETKIPAQAHIILIAETWTDNGGSDPNSNRNSKYSSNDYFMKLCKNKV